MTGLVLPARGSESVEDYLQKLIKSQHPVISWDWHGTLSANSFWVRRDLIEVMQKLTRYHGFGHIIVSSSTCQEFAIMGWSKSLNPPEPIIIRPEDGAHPFRFKMWVLHTLFKNGFGPMKLHIDDSEDLVYLMRQKGLPIIMVGDCSYEYIRQFLTLYRGLGQSNGVNLNSAGAS